MVDLDELDAAINRCAFDGDVLGLSKAECRDLLTRLRQAEKDAARYRFMKEWSQSYSLNVYRKELWDEIVDREIHNESRRLNKLGSFGE